MTLEGCIKEFLKIQYTRTSISNEFYEAMDEYFAKKINDNQIQQVIKISTDGLVECSKDESDIEKKLSETYQRKDLESLMKTIIEQEKAKMADTIMRYQHHIKSDPDREPEEDNYEKENNERSEKIEEAMEELRSELAEIVASNIEEEENKERTEKSEK